MGKTPRNVAKQLNMNSKIAPPTDIKEMFGSSGGSETEIVKELFSVNGIKAKTEVSDREISIISRLYFLSKYINNPTLSEMLDNFLTLKISRKRKSRQEFIDGLKGMPKNDFSISGLK